ncbi:MAG: hypothetical protein LBV29_03170 [Azoarcus sp.]|jgi:hypothetical protein|nr:hypothetical protein [Azoarcus sp.]
MMWFISAELGLHEHGWVAARDNVEAKRVMEAVLGTDLSGYPVRYTAPFVATHVRGGHSAYLKSSLMQARSRT